MQLKDYYKTLEIAPAASALQVKKSFRRLAIRYHPDKNPGSVYAEAQFKEIREAYEILSDPLKREEYNYKRWYSRSLGKIYKEEAITPAAILAECERLNHFIAGANVFHVDFDALSYHIRQLLSDTNIGILLQANDGYINRQVVKKILQSGSPLPFYYLEPIAVLLMRIAGNDKEMTDHIRMFLQQQQQKNHWQRYKIIAILIITVLLCWVIYRLSK